MHHPFTAPREQDRERLTELLRCLEEYSLLRAEHNNINNINSSNSISSNSSSPAPISSSPSSSSPLPPAAAALISRVRVLCDGIRGQHYDLVVNGVELGGGSVRIHTKHLQESVLRALQCNTATFQHLLEALSFGCPPHGGIAFGMDRMVALLCDPSVKDLSSSLGLIEVIAFPKTRSGLDLLSGGPSLPAQETLKTYHMHPHTHSQPE